MTREIKFRAWDGYQWHYEDIFLAHDGTLWLRNNDRTLTKVDWVVVLYTGLKDKNSKEIWEGDIVRIDWFLGDFQITPIIWKEGGFTYKDTRYDFDGLLDAEKVEVIGNTYENPELLKDIPKT